MSGEVALERVPLLDGLRVLEFATEIAGPYAGRLLADLGADVIKIESAAGDPLRKWSASHTELGGRDGALFQFLNATKRSMVGDLREQKVARLVSEADLLVESGQLSRADISELRMHHPRLVIVSITPFGRQGPWADRPASEFTLQALCGSTASRGHADREPLHAGGRIGEWISGAYTAVAALGALVGRNGEHMDVSMLECMAITLGGYGHLHASLAGVLSVAANHRGPFRTVESPSIEPTCDGLVGFCTVTAQQFSDLGSLIGRPDIGDDPRFRGMLARMKNHEEFERILHAWTTANTSAEIIEIGALLRIPVAPIGRPDSITTFDHFEERKVFVDNPAGFTQPRPPYFIAGVPLRPLTLAPALGQHDDESWSIRPGRPEVSARSATRPLHGIRVIDLTAFWAGPSATNVLAALGADVIKVESAKRPDGMRLTSVKTPDDARWWEWSPVYQGNNANKRDLTLDLATAAGRKLVLDLFATADVVIENSSPRVMDSFGLTWQLVHARNPATIMVRMPAFGLTGPWRDRTGFAQTMEQASGMAWISGFADRVPVIPRGVCDPLAGMHAVVVLLAALRDRDATGEGHLIEVAMIEAALNVAAELVIERSAYGVDLMRAGNRGPAAAPQGVYACGHTESWVAVAVQTDAQWTSFCEVLGQSRLAVDSRFATEAGRRRAHDELDDELSAVFAARQLDEVVDTLIAGGVPAAAVVGPAAVPRNPQLRARGFIETIDGPVVGHHEVFGLPFRMASREGPWFEAPAPALGQHNREVLREVLGLDDAAIAQLTTADVIGNGLK